MTLDLQKDAEKIRSFILDRIRKYKERKNIGPGKAADPISLVIFGYYIEQAGYFALVFDTRPDAENDGNWTLHIENKVNVLSFPKWCTAFEKLCDGGTVEVTLPDGKTRTLDDSDDNDTVAELFGEVILETVQSLRDEGAFNSLPLAPMAFFIIEEFDGHWGWPEYEKRKTLGRLRES